MLEHMSSALSNSDELSGEQRTYMNDTVRVLELTSVWRMTSSIRGSPVQTVRWPMNWMADCQIPGLDLGCPSVNRSLARSSCQARSLPTRIWNKFPDKGFFSVQGEKNKTQLGHNRISVLGSCGNLECLLESRTADLR